MEIKNAIIQYINEHELLKERIAFDTNIDVEKLDENSKADLTGEELLKVCAYLGVDPEQFYKKKLNKQNRK